MSKGKKLINRIRKAFPGAEFISFDGVETRLTVPRIPGYVVVNEAGGITMTFHNIIPGPVAVKVLKAIAERK